MQSYLVRVCQNDEQGSNKASKSEPFASEGLLTTRLALQRTDASLHAYMAKHMGARPFRLYFRFSPTRSQRQKEFRLQNLFTWRLSAIFAALVDKASISRSRLRQRGGIDRSRPIGLQLTPSPQRKHDNSVQAQIFDGKIRIYTKTVYNTHSPDSRSCLFCTSMLHRSTARKVIHDDG